MTARQGRRAPPGRRLEDFDDDGGGVVAAGILDGGFDEVLGDGLAVGGVAGHFVDLAVPETIDETVGADEEAIAGLVSDAADVRIDELVAGAEGLLEGVAARVGAVFAFVHFSGAAELADERVIVGDLGEAALAGKVVDAAVADVAEVHPTRREPGEAERAAHAGAFLVGVAQFEEVVVDVGEELGKDVLETAGKAGGAEAEGAREETRNAIDGDAAGELAGFGAAHAVADGEDEIGAGEGGVAGFAEVAEFVSVEIEREESVFVVGAETAHVGEAGPAQGRGRSGRLRGWGWSGGLRGGAH